VVNELRSTPGKSWKLVEARLVDYDKATRQDEKEVQGHVYQAKVALSTAGDRIHKLEKQVQQLTALVAKTSNQKPKSVKKQVKAVKRCWECGAEGHTKPQCPKNKQSNKKKNKGHGKGNF
jgi:septation ring formation regulator EzrA